MVYKKKGETQQKDTTFAIKKGFKTMVYKKKEDDVAKDEAANEEIKNEEGDENYEGYGEEYDAEDEDAQEAGKEEKDEGDY